ncbi:NlpC/P60 family protein [Micromonospora sp. DR5-3]|uniref:C40 family peptidase n=1 Tax=unclassified Micromonospora TaxID=2617518 RepID=UPI0011E7F8BB|nr:MULTISPECIES: NlpC/P60 family protein [unclassified Micromonospora]MCW3815807.1 NlpC/P60 family protein [Micromonospora sp. DR5-3]
MGKQRLGALDAIIITAGSASSTGTTGNSITLATRDLPCDPSFMPDGEDEERFWAVRVAAAGLWASPQAPRELDMAVLQCPVLLRDWLDEQDQPTRKELQGRIESQLLLGETVRVDAQVDGWAKVVALSQPSHKDASGYPGWVRSAQLATPAVETGVRVVVTARAVDVLSAPDGEVLIPDVSFATVLPEVHRASGWVHVNLPGNGRGCLPEAKVATYRQSGPLPTGDDFVAIARQFIGVGFLPGGIHGLGFDCSGLIHMLYRRFGHAFPRDAEDAFEFGQDIQIDDLQPGDIVYFTRPHATKPYHCGINTGPLTILHTTYSDGRCVDGGLIDQRRGYLVNGRRFLSPVDRP